MTTRDLVSFLKEQTVNKRFIDRIKIAYRPYICPFDDLLEKVEVKDRVMDIGCGSGQFCALVQHFCHPEKVSGIEIAQHLIDNANSIFASNQVEEDRFDFQVYDGQTIPAVVAEYNRIFMIDVLHHIQKKDQLSFLRQLFEKSSEKSIIVLKDMDRTFPFGLTNKFHDLLFSGEIGCERTPDECRNMLESVGYKIDKIESRTMFMYKHYTIIGTK